MKQPKPKILARRPLASRAKQSPNTSSGASGGTAGGSDGTAVPSPIGSPLGSDPSTFASFLQNIAQSDDPLSQNSAVTLLDDVTWQDFSYYHYLTEPKFASQAGPSTIDETVVNELNAGIAPYGSTLATSDQFFVDFITYTLTPAYNSVSLSPTPHNQVYPQEFMTLHESAIGVAALWSRLYVMYWAIPSPADRIAWLSTLAVPMPQPLNITFQVPALPNPVSVVVSGNAYQVLWQIVRFAWPVAAGNISSLTPSVQDVESLIQADLSRGWAIAIEDIEQAWESTYGEDVDALAGTSSAESQYPFDFYDPTEPILGLRLIYRQEWRPLGMQRGEIVRTVPLGPKQTQKVSTKITRRVKTTQSQETNKESETNTESTDTTKDSSDLIKEASSTFNWHLEAEASYGGGLSPFSAKVSSGLSLGNSSSSKSTSDQLTETMQKTATKIRNQTKIVVSTETESTYEQVNATEIQNPNDEIALTFIYSKLQRQYEIFTSLAEVDGVILVPEMVPQAFEIDVDWVKEYDWIIARSLLDESYRDTLNSIANDVSPMQLDSTVQGRIESAMDNATGGITKLAATSNALMQVDVVQEAQKSFRDIKNADLQAQMAIERFNETRERFFNHIRQNVLHYCRAIWSAEDPDQRVLRYRKLGLSLPEFWEYVPAAGTTPVNGGVSGVFVPTPPTAGAPNPQVFISDIIDPSGPIGYFANFAVYRLTPTDSDPALSSGASSINDLLMAAASNYLGENLPDIYDNSAHAPQADPLTGLDPITAAAVQSAAGIVVDPAMANLINQVVQALNNPPGGTPPTGFDLATGIPSTFNPALRALMTDMVPELRGQVGVANPTSAQIIAWCAQPNVTDTTFYPYYYEYLFRVMSSRQFLMDTNNLVVDIEPGKGTALEQFKLLHRAIDVEKAAWDAANLALEYQRRQGLIAANKLGDPKVDKVVAVSTIKDLDLNVDPGN